jgi:hypothetical protein
MPITTTRVGPTWIIVAFVAGAFVAVVLLDRVLRLDLGEGGFWAQLWPALFATLVGVILGVLAAAEIERRRDGRARRAEEADLLRTAQEAVESNLELCQGLTTLCNHVQAGEGIGVTLPMDVGLLDAIFPRLAQISPDRALVRELNHFGHELRHLDRQTRGLARCGARAGWPAAGVIQQLAAQAERVIQVLDESGQGKLPALFSARLNVLGPTGVQP